MINSTHPTGMGKEKIIELLRDYPRMKKKSVCSAMNWSILLSCHRKK